MSTFLSRQEVTRVWTCSAKQKAERVLQDVKFSVVLMEMWGDSEEGRGSGDGARVGAWGGGGWVSALESG